MPTIIGLDVTSNAINMHTVPPTTLPVRIRKFCAVRLKISVLVFSVTAYISLFRLRCFEDDSYRHDFQERTTGSKHKDYATRIMWPRASCCKLTSIVSWSYSTMEVTVQNVTKSKNWSAHTAAVFQLIKNISLRWHITFLAESVSFPQLLQVQISYSLLTIPGPQYQQQRKHNNSTFRRMDGASSCSFGFSIPHIGFFLFVNNPIQIKMDLIYKPDPLHNTRICFVGVSKLSQGLSNNLFMITQCLKNLCLARILL